jgi:integrase
MAKSKSDLVFSREDGVSPISAFILIQQQERMRKLLKLPWDACVHSARHTALTNLGPTGVDTFTLQRAAGHANVTTTRKYVHPTPPTMKDAFQKKVRNERRDRRMTRKRVARMASIPSNGDHPLHLVQFTEVKNSGTQWENSGDFRGLRVTGRHFSLLAV